MRIVTVNKGKAAHLAFQVESHSGRISDSVRCGVIKHDGSNHLLRPTGQPLALENITCKNCKQRYLEAAT